MLYFRSPELTHLRPFHQCLSSSPFSFPQTKYFLLFFIHLFIFGCAGSLLFCAGFLWLRYTGSRHLGFGSSAQGLVDCGPRAVGCAGFSSCGIWAQSLLSTQNLPDQGLNPCPLHWQVYSYPLYQQGSLKFLAILIGRKNQNKTHFTLAFSLLAIRLNIFSFVLTVCISSVNSFSSFPFICSCVSITYLF